MSVDIEEFKEFFYRTVHNWYFDKYSLSQVSLAPQDLKRIIHLDMGMIFQTL